MVLRRGEAEFIEFGPDFFDGLADGLDTAFGFGGGSGCPNVYEGGGGAEVFVVEVGTDLLGNTVFSGLDIVFGDMGTGEAEVVVAFAVHEEVVAVGGVLEVDGLAAE